MQMDLVFSDLITLITSPESSINNNNDKDNNDIKVYCLELLKIMFYITNVKSRLKK
jgi:hypothetical protein